MLMGDVTWCQMAGWRLRLGQACTMTITRGIPEISAGTVQCWRSTSRQWEGERLGRVDVAKAQHEGEEAGDAEP